MEKELKDEEDKVVNVFMDALNIDHDFASVLCDNGFTTLEEIAYVPVSEFLTIDGLDESIANALQENAKEAIAKRNEDQVKESCAKLEKLDGIDSMLALKLVQAGIHDAEELAEMATDDLSSIEGLDENKAGEIIMTARNECWFKQE